MKVHIDEAPIHKNHVLFCALDLSEYILSGVWPFVLDEPAIVCKELSIFFFLFELMNHRLQLSWLAQRKHNEFVVLM
uniref:Uncharacterized protein n=1 Tax=Anguilla anguilla TaxID=7936 RepID=A0A0E9QNU8_ANGAN